jgi:predicted dehydrogenase
MNLPMEDEAIVILKSKDSAVKGIVNVGWYQRSVFPDFNFRFIAHGNAGFTSTNKYAPRNLYQHALREGTKNIARRITGRKIRPLSYTYYYEPYLKELDIFFNSVKRDEDPPVTVDDGLKTVEIITKVYQDARTKVHSPESHEGAP